MVPDWIWYVFIFAFGSCVGSFLNVVILRLPPLLEHDWRCQCQELLALPVDVDQRPPGIVFSRSRCPHCGYGIRVHENIPILSFLFLRGHCSSCKSKISLRYPLVELATAVAFVITV